MQRAYVICRLKKKSDDNADSPNGDEGHPRGEFHAPPEIRAAPPEIQVVRISEVFSTLTRSSSSNESIRSLSKSEQILFSVSLS